MARWHPCLQKSAILTIDFIAVLVGCLIAAPFALTLVLPFMPEF